MYFEYMYLQYHIFVLVLRIHISYFHGHDTVLLGFISVNSSGLPLLGLVHCAGGVPISSPCPIWNDHFHLYFSLNFDVSFYFYLLSF